MSAVLAFLLAAPAPIIVPPWAEFSRSEARSGVNETVLIDYSREVVPGRMEYRLTYVRRLRMDIKSSSTTSVACPAARGVIGSMRDIEMPRFAPYGFAGDNQSSVRDGTFYSLRAPTNFLTGEMTIKSNVGSPLASWIDNAFKALEPCWKTA